MKRSKIQDPRSRKDPKSKPPNGTSDGSAYTLRNWDSEIVLKEDGGDKALHPFDLEERTAKFGEAIIRLLKRIPRSPENDRLISQLAGCGTSVGANYCEANEGVSKKDFRCTIGCCIKEAKETKFFLRMVAASEPQLAPEARPLYREASELLRIFCAMRRK